MINLTLKQNKTPTYRRANQAKKSKRLYRILPAVMGLIASLLVIAFVASLLFSRYGGFTIKVKEYGDNDYALTLCEEDSFLHPTSKLSAVEVKNINNISYVALPDNLNDVNGAHNGKNYLAYTFYIKNVGTKECSYEYSLSITQATLGVDAAVRVRIYFNPDYYKAATGEYDRNGRFTDYAKPKTGGNGAPETDMGDRVMTNFTSHDTVVKAKIDGFAPNDIAKMTVVIWLEGDDPDCTDDVMGGSFRTDMNIEIVS